MSVRTLLTSIGILYVSASLASCAVEGPAPPIHPERSNDSRTRTPIRTPLPYPESFDSLVWTERTDGLKISDRVVGSGTQVDGSAQTVVLEITGWLLDGTRWWSSYDGLAPTRFSVGRAPMRALDLGVVGMRAGGMRLIEAPAQLAFRSDGAQGRVPPDAAVLLALELLDVSDCRELPAPVAPSDIETSSTGLRFADIRIGEGATLYDGALISFDRTEWLSDGSVLGTSCRALVPSTVRYGAGLLRWEDAFVGMREGGIRQIWIDPAQRAETLHSKEGASIIDKDAPLVIAIALHAVRPSE